MSKEKYARIRALLDKASSRFVSASFIKKDGTERVMVINMLATRTHVIGDAASDAAKRATQTRKANNPNLLPVYDVHAQGIRQINMDTLLTLVIDGQTYDFTDQLGA